MIHHCVFCKIDQTTSAAQLEQVMQSLMALKATVPGILSASHGANIDLERKSQGFSHGFIMVFESRAALDAYHTDPAHQAAGAQLVAICEGGADGIMVFDLEISA